MKTSPSIFLIFIILFISCVKPVDYPIRELKYLGDKKAGRLIQADNEFGLNLFRLLVLDKGCPENIMMSPVSVAIALGMTYNGAEGSTKTAFEETLRLNDLTREEINNIHNELIDYLVSADNRITFTIANSIWYKKLYNVLQTFIDASKKYYYAEVRDMDFSDPASVNIINNWIAQKTDDKVRDVLDNTSEDIVMYLINALYFNGLWQYEFEEKNSFQGKFFGDNEDLNVKYMRNTSSYRFFQNELLSVVELPYGSGNFVMDVFLPKEEKCIEDLLSQMNSSNWKEWMGLLKEPEKISVQLPQFKYQYKSLLNNPLCNMGLEEAFDSRANFSGINPDANFFISRVIHQTFIDVNEKGTEAAAVTVIEIKDTASMDNTKYFIADKPFIYAIREIKTGALLFMGKVGHPEYK